MKTVQEVANPATALVHGQETVDANGTAQAITGTATALKHGAFIKALEGNTGNVYVGDSDVSATNGYELGPGDVVFLPILNLATVYIDAATNDDGVSFLGT